MRRGGGLSGTEDDGIDEYRDEKDEEGADSTSYDNGNGNCDDDAEDDDADSDNVADAIVKMKMLIDSQ